MKFLLEYYLIRFILFPLSFLPYSWIHKLGRVIGYIAFYALTNFRKKTLSNLAMAKSLCFSSKEIRKIAIESFQNMAINCLEMPKLSREKNLSNIVQCDNPEVAESLFKKGTGIVFFCGHQSNWDVLFLDGNLRMKGIAIGKAIKNPYLYNWIVRIREKTGGKIIPPRKALKEGLRALKKGVFVGIVGDQGMPDSGYQYPFFGRKAWNSTAPALLAYKTRSPIIVASTRRVHGGYRTHYSDPIWPDLNNPMEEEIKRMMDTSLSILEQSIADSPGEWLWQHNRWKQQTPDRIYRPFRKDCICIVLPNNQKECSSLKDHLPMFRKVYPEEHITVIAPRKCKLPLLFATETIYYSSFDEVFREDYRFKLLFNFTNNTQIEKHYEKLSVLQTCNLKHLMQKKDHSNNLTTVLKNTLLRPEARSI